MTFTSPDSQENQASPFPPIARFPSLHEDDLNTIRNLSVRNMLRQDINLLNQAIDSYNQVEPTHDKKLEALQGVDRARKAIENNYPAYIFFDFPQLQNHLRINLFNQTKQAASALGYSSLLDLYHSEDSNRVPFADLLANMDPDILENLAQIISKVPFNKKAFSKLYPENDPNYPDFKAFIDHGYSISCLGQAERGNSRNFLIEVPGQEPFVLKLNARLNQPAQHEVALRQTQPSPLASVFAERPINVGIKSDKKLILSSSVSIGEYCAAGDLATKVKQSSRRSLLDCVLDVSINSADLLINLEKAGYGLSDSKFTNLLARSDGTVCLADTKALLEVNNSNGHIDLTQGNNLQFDLITSHGFFNPEFATENSFSADKMHAYQLGKNIYQSLTGCDLNQLTHLTSLRLSAEIMKQSSSLTPAKKELLVLVARLIEENPENRPTMLEAKAQLHRIKQLHEENKRAETNFSSAPTQQTINSPPPGRFVGHLFTHDDLTQHRTECFSKLSELRQLGFGQQDRDRLMKSDLDKIEKQISGANIPKLEKIASSLDTMISQQKDPDLQEIRQFIIYLRHNASLMTIGMRKKADKIEQAMLKISPDKRAGILSSDSPAANAVKKALHDKSAWSPFSKQTNSFESFKNSLSNRSPLAENNENKRNRQMS